MRRSLALLIPSLALAAACTQSPTAVAKHPAVRFDGGNYHGTGNVVDPSGGTTGSGNVTGNSSNDGGNTMGSGNATGSGSTSSGGATSLEDGGIFFGGGHISSAATNTAVADSAAGDLRGGNTMGSGN